MILLLAIFVLTSCWLDIQMNNIVLYLTAITSCKYFCLSTAKIREEVLYNCVITSVEFELDCLFQKMAVLVVSLF